MEITKIKIGSNVYDIKDNAAITAQGVTQAVNQALYGSTTAPSGATVVTSENISTIAQQAGIGGASVTEDTIYTELYGLTVKPNGAYVVTNQNISTAITNAGISTGGASTYSQLGYATSHINGSGALTIAGTDPVYVVTVSANISSVALQNNPMYGHSCHIIFKSADSSSYTVAIGNDSTNRICPTFAGLTLTVPAAGSGYVEVDFLNTGDSNIGDEVYVRGV